MSDPPRWTAATPRAMSACFRCIKPRFLCSRQCPAAAALKIYEWARQMREKKACVISGFHTPMEKDVREILSAGNSPQIWVCARALPLRPSAPVQKSLKEGELLIVSPFPRTPRPTQKTTHLRTLYILSATPQPINPPTPPPTAAYKKPWMNSIPAPPTGKTQTAEFFSPKSPNLGGFWRIIHFWNTQGMENFKVKVKDFGKLANADIRIGRFTVFAGRNSTGKSFMSKALYLHLRSVKC